jgi:hypothetical protein
LKNRVADVLVVAGILLALLFALMVLEASGGHDGYLCEWGYDTGATSDGCG